jgi:hypothetical protein
MEANKNFAKWLSCGIQISGTFGLHHVYSFVWATLQLDKQSNWSILSIVFNPV